MILLSVFIHKQLIVPPGRSVYHAHLPLHVVLFPLFDDLIGLRDGFGRLVHLVQPSVQAGAVVVGL